MYSEAVYREFGYEVEKGVIWLPSSAGQKMPPIWYQAGCQNGVAQKSPYQTPNKPFAWYNLQKDGVDPYRGED